MPTNTVLNALEMDRRAHGGRRLVGLVAHTDVGSEFPSVRSTVRVEEFRSRPSIGTDADRCDNALMETTNGPYRIECFYRPEAPRSWEDLEELQLATLSWVYWFNEDLLHSNCRDAPPAKYEQAFHAAQQADPAEVGFQQPGPPSDPGRLNMVHCGHDRY